VRSEAFIYLRNYSPHLPVMQFNGYSFEIPGYLAWREAWRQGECNPVQAQWFEPKASEELYRIADDPDNVRNLAADPRLADTLARLRSENDRHIRAVRDSVFYPEGMAGREWAAYQDDNVYPMDRLIPLANAVSARDPKNLPAFEQAMRSGNKCLRYWGVTGCVVLGDRARPLKDSLVARLKDDEPIVRLQAARALAGMGETEMAIPVIRRFLKNPSAELSLQAALAIDECELLKSDPSLRDSLKLAKGQYAARVVKKLNDENRAQPKLKK
jgi:HEAT repeat protein